MKRVQPGFLRSLVLTSVLASGWAVDPGTTIAAPTPQATPGSMPGSGGTKSSGDGSMDVGFWEQADAMTQPRARHTATLLPGGGVLVAGGCSAYDERMGGVCKQITDSTELFDPERNGWVKGPPMKTPRIGHSATLLDDGRVLVVGGCVAAVSGGLFGCRTTTASSEIYDPGSARWQETRPMKWSRTEHPAAVIPAGRTSACAVNCGKVLVVGNRPESFGGMQAVAPELYDPDAGTWEETALTGSPRIPGDCCVPTLTPLQDGTILLMGTVYAPDDPAKTAASFYRPSSGSWKGDGEQPKIKRFLASVTRLSDGKVLAAGGHPGLAEPSIAQSELYEPREPSGSAGPGGTWRATGRMAVARRAHRAVLLPDGEVLVIGGGVADGSGEGAPAAADAGRPPGFIRSAELYDPKTSKWKPAGEMAAGRGDTLYDRSRPADFTATVLEDGRVLVAGGAVPLPASTVQSLDLRPRTALKDSEIYTPANLRGQADSEGWPHTAKKSRPERWLVGVLGVVLLSGFSFLMVRRARRRR